MILSGTSTTTSSKKEPKTTGRFAACVAANTASPQTFPVVPPQKITFNGVEINTAARPPAKEVSNAPLLFHFAETCHNTNDKTNAKTCEGIH